MPLGILQADHVDRGELGGLSGRAGGWNTVPRWSVLPWGLLPGPRRSELQLLPSCSGERPAAQARAGWDLPKGHLGAARGRGRAWVLHSVISHFPGPVAHSAEQAAGAPLPGRCPLLSWLLLPPHRLWDLQLLPVPRGEGAMGSTEGLRSVFGLSPDSPRVKAEPAWVSLCPTGRVLR